MAKGKDNTDGKAPSAIVKAWKKIGIDYATAMKMLKFAMPPAISLSIFQSNAIAGTFSTVGYLIAVGSILSSGLAPRASFIEATVCDIIFLSITAPVTLFAMWTVFRAREITSQPDPPSGSYSASASAVAGVWLFFMLYVINSLKFTRPQFKFASVMASIMTIVGMTYAPQFASMSEALQFVRRIYGALMSGIAITTGISLLFNPTSCRQIVFADIAQYISQLREVLELERKYMSTLELQNPFRSVDEAKDVKTKVQALRTTHGKLFADMTPAKKEIAYGRLLPSDLSEIQRMLRRVFLPAVGMSSIISIFERLTSQHGWGETDPETASEHQMRVEYQDIFHTLHEPLERLHQTMSEAFDHILYRLQLNGWKVIRDRIRHRQAEEKSANFAGDDQFAGHFDREIEQFYEQRILVLRHWCQNHDIHLAPDSFESDFDWTSNDGETLFGTPIQRQLFIVLYIEYLQWSCARSLLQLVKFADFKVADGTMLKKRFVYPGRKTAEKWLSNFARNENEDQMEGHAALRSTGDATRTLWTDTFKGFRRDPEHMPITSPIQNVGRYLRKLGAILRSQHSQFGFRLACAAMSIQIIGYLKSTQLFFVEQRLFWASVMVAVSMTRMSGEASFIYALRLAGTFVGAVCCYIIFYIVDEKPPGVLVIYFLFLVLYAYVPVKHPRYALAAVIAAVTSTLVIGYELQVLVIGTTEATTNRQRFYPVYLLAPYRFATTAVGIFVAYLFTVAPFPISEGSELRKDVGIALYTLANHYSLVQETVGANITGEHGDLSIRTSPGRKMERARVKLMSRQMLLIQSMRAQLNFTKWQFPLDAPFPRERYGRLIDIIEDILNFTALIGYTSTAFALQDEARPETEEWHASFALLQDNIQQTSDEVTSLLCLLSSSILYAQPLPPHLHLPPPYSLLQRMQATNRKVLDISHVAERGYAAFAVLQVATRTVIIDLYRLVDEIRELVGELDFSKPYSSTNLSRYNTPKRKLY